MAAVARAAEIAFVVEVSDSTISYDRLGKLPLYAGVGIPEAWIVDPNEDVVEVHANPGPQGYGSVSRFGRRSQMVPVTLLGLRLATDGLLPVEQPRAGSPPESL